MLYSLCSHAMAISELNTSNWRKFHWERIKYMVLPHPLFYWFSCNSRDLLSFAVLTCMLVDTYIQIHPCGICPWCFPCTWLVCKGELRVQNSQLNFRCSHLEFGSECCMGPLLRIQWRLLLLGIVDHHIHNGAPPTSGSMCWCMPIVRAQSTMWVSSQ